MKSWETSPEKYILDLEQYIEELESKFETIEGVRHIDKR